MVVSTSPTGGSMAETVLGGVKRASGWSIVLGILMILAGMLAILRPLVAGVFIVYIVAWTAIFNGGAQIVYGFRTQSGGRMVLEVLLGLLYIVAGIFILMHPAGGLLALTLIIACIPAGLRRFCSGAGVPDAPACGVGMGAVRCDRYDLTGLPDLGTLAHQQ